MKNKIFTLLLITTLLLMMSCNKDFLELPPISLPVVEVLYKTDKDFQDAITGCYASLRDQYENMYIFGDVRSDDSWHALGNNVSMVAIDNFAERSSESVYASTWSNYYKTIDRANLVLSKIENADVSVVINKERYIAEAKFLRAFAYFDLVRIFGDVPKVTVPISIDASYEMKRESVSKIYEEVIIPDLSAAENALPQNYSGVDIGRCTKGAAKALLGKVYLYIKNFQNAESKLQEVTTMNYALLPKYNDLFDYTKDEHHSEYIFDIEYLTGGTDVGSYFSNNFLPKSTDSHAEEYFGIVGGAGELNTPTWDLYYAFDNNDPRRNITVDSGYYDNGVWYDFFQIETFTQKYLAATPSNGHSLVNWKVIRYADVLLMYAEALNENNKTELAISYLNQIRNRVGMSQYSNLSKDETREKIYHERRLELGMEGHRWFDLIRTGRALDICESLGMKSHNQVFPIPLREIQVVNDPNIFPQNPEYD